VFKESIRQGTVFLAADSRNHAEAQLRDLKRDLKHWWVRRQVQFGPRLFALGSAARQDPEFKEMVSCC
jgi:hypothetical protein